MLEMLKKNNRITIFNSKNKIDKMLIFRNPKYVNLSIKIDNIFYNKRDSLIKLKNSIKNFITIMRYNCENFNDDIFLKNINICFYDIRNIDQDMQNDISGQIYYLNNYCELKVDSMKIINHELNHLASIPYFDDNSAKKFSENLKCINGIYEGYTQLLAERYFDEYPCGYIFSAVLASNIEDIIGRNRMESMYYSGNFINLEKELEQYLSKEDISKLKIYSMKIIEIEMNIKNILDYLEVNTIQNYLDIIYEILVRGFKNMMKKEHYIIEEDRIFNKDLWTWTATSEKLFGNGYLHALTEEQYNNIYNEIFNYNIKK